MHLVALPLPEVVRRWHIKSRNLAPAEPLSPTQMRALLAEAAALASELDQLRPPRRGRRPDPLELPPESASHDGTLSDDLRDLCLSLDWARGQMQAVQLARPPGSSEPRGAATPKTPLTVANGPAGPRAVPSPLHHLEARLVTALQELVARASSLVRGGTQGAAESEGHPSPTFSEAPSSLALESLEPTWLDFPGPHQEHQGT